MAVGTSHGYPGEVTEYPAFAMARLIVVQLRSLPFRRLQRCAYGGLVGSLGNGHPDEHGHAFIGEALSIRQMIDALLARRSIDPSRVYIVGFSAGGAMARPCSLPIRSASPAVQSWPVCLMAAPIA